MVIILMNYHCYGFMAALILDMPTTGFVPVAKEHAMTTQSIKLMTLGLYRKSTPARRTGTLRKGRVEALRGLGGATLRCTEGTLWVTVQGDTHDYVLTQGQTLAVPNLGKVLVSGSGSYQV